MAIFLGAGRREKDFLSCHPLESRHEIHEQIRRKGSESMVEGTENGIHFVVETMDKNRIEWIKMYLPEKTDPDEKDPDEASNEKEK